jgi:hypothetical protein
VEIKMTNLELNYLNLGSYKMGTLNLPATEEVINEFWETLNPMDSDCELQFVVSDLDSDLDKLSLSQLQIVSELDNIEDFDKLYQACDSFEEAIEMLENSSYTIFENCENDYDLGYEIAERNGIITDEESILARYFDYEAYGRDVRFEGSFHWVDATTVVELHRG